MTDRGRQPLLAGLGLALCGALFLLSGTIQPAIGVAIGVVGVAVLVTGERTGGSPDAPPDPSTAADRADGGQR